MMGTITNHYCLIILGIIFPLSHISQIQRNHEWITKSNNFQKNEISFLHVCYQNGLAANLTANYLKSWKGQNPSSSRGHHFIRNAHGILNMIGWGGLIPIGVIIARNFRRNPVKCEEWYNLHIVFQTSGYIIGAIGWSFGLWLGTNGNKHHALKTHQNLGIIIFTFATLQMVAAIWLQPKREYEYRRRWWWVTCHKTMGYALIAMIIANIFEGIQNQPHHQHLWKWIYVGLLVILGFFALSLEIFRCLMIKPEIQRQIMAFDLNSYTPT